MPSYSQSKRPLRIGDRAEFAGELVTIIDELNGKLWIRHANGMHSWEWSSKLTWLPSEAELEAATEEAKRQHLEQKRGQRPPHDDRESGLKEIHDPPLDSMLYWGGDDGC